MSKTQKGKEVQATKSAFLPASLAKPVDGSCFAWHKRSINSSRLHYFSSTFICFLALYKRIPKHSFGCMGPHVVHSQVKPQILCTKISHAMRWSVKQLKVSRCHCIPAPCANTGRNPAGFGELATSRAWHWTSACQIPAQSCSETSKSSLDQCYLLHSSTFLYHENYLR